MKIAVINFSGNVGKSTLARHLLLPRIPDAEFIAIESVNAGEGPSATLRGDQFAALQEYLHSIPSAVVDIGASSVQEFLELNVRMISQTPDSTEKMALAQRLATCRLASSVVAQLDACFAGLDLPTSRIDHIDSSVGATP